MKHIYKNLPPRKIVSFFQHQSQSQCSEVPDAMTPCSLDVKYDEEGSQQTIWALKYNAEKTVICINSI